MYENLYHLHSDPFRLAPDPKFCYEHERFRKGRAYMKYAVSQGDGILMVTGHPGTGKTMLIEHFLCALDRSSLLTATLLNTQVEEDDLFRMVGFGFGMNVRNLDRATILHDLQEFLVTKRRSGHRALLIVDEAQNLSASALEQLRMLTNLTDRSQPLLQLFLVGQKQLIDIVHTPAMEPLYQRLIAAAHLEPLGLEETAAYIQHRLRCAGWQGDPHLNKDIRVLIHRFSGGYPRLINKISGRLLLYGSVSEKHRLDAEDFFSALDQVQDEYLMPGNEIYGIAMSSDMHEIMHDRSDNADWKQRLTREEKAFLEKSEPDLKPDSVVDAISPLPDIARASDGRTPPEPAPTTVGMPSQPVARPEPQPDPRVVTRNEEAAPRYNAPQPATVNPEYAQAPGVRDGSPRRGYHWLSMAASVILLVSVFVLFTKDFGPYLEGQPLQNSETLASAGALPPDSTPQAPPDPAIVSTVAASYEQQIPSPDTEPRHQDTKAWESGITHTAEEPVPESVAIARVEGGFHDAEFAVLTSETVSDAPITDDSVEPIKNDPVTEERTPVPTITISRTPSPVTDPDEPAPGPADPVDADTVATAEPPAPVKVAWAAPTHVTKKSAEPELASEDPDRVQEKAEREIKRLLASAQNAYRRDYLTTPPSESAYRFLRRVLNQDPDNQAAMRGMNQIVKRYNVLARAALEREEYELVQTLTRRGLRVEPDNRNLRILQAKAQLLRDEALARQEAAALAALPAIEEPYEQLPGTKPDDSLFGKIRAFFDDLTTDDVSTNVFESAETY